MSKDTFYVKEIDGRCYMQPLFEATDISAEGVEKILEMKLTLKEFGAWFEDFKEGRLESWGKKPGPLPLVVKTSSSEDELEIISLELETPKISTANLGIFTSPPKLSFDSDDDGIKDEEGLTVDEKASLLASICMERFATLKHKWTQTFLEVEAGYSTVVKDLQNLRTYASGCKLLIGYLDAVDAGESATVWTKIYQLGDLLKIQTSDVEHLTTMMSAKLGDVQHQHGALRQDLQLATIELETSTRGTEETVHAANLKIASLEATIAEYERRFAYILPILVDLKRQGPQAPHLPSVTPSVSSLTLASVQEQLKALSAKVDRAATQPTPSRLYYPGDTFGSEERMQDLENQVRLLQQRILGGGVQIGTKTFQSFEDVQVWVVAELPIHRYGLFVDAVSLLNFFSFLGHIDTERQLSAFHSQQKAGFATQYESRVATSIQNLFPHVFGKTGSDDSQYLPGVTSPDKWDNGSHGLKHSINKGMGLVEKQVENAIHSVLTPYPEAKRLALECLYKAKRFITELCTFISDDFAKWKSRGHGKIDAWQMTLVCVRRIFEEIHAERIVARDGYDHQDVAFTTARILWATWKAHMIMDRYLKHQFYEHPAVAAILARHLADNYVKPDDAVSTKVNSLAQQLQTLKGQVDTICNSKKENKADYKEYKNNKGKIVKFATTFKEE
jgi:hypothetical protein